MGPTYGEAQNNPFQQNQTPTQTVGGTTVPTQGAQAPTVQYDSGGNAITVPRPAVQPPGVQYDGAGNVIRPAPASGTPGTPANIEGGRALSMPGHENFRINAAGNLLQAPQPATLTSTSPVMSAPVMSEPVTAAQARAAQAAAGSYQAAVNKVSQDALVRKQLEGLLAQGSKYLDQARQQAAQTANKRGFLNSSFAAGAGERAAISQALPIAVQDAGTFNQRELAAMDAINQANQFNAAQTTQTNIANAGFNNQTSQFNAGQANSMAQFNAGRADNMAQFNAGRADNMAQFNASQANSMAQFNAGQANSMAQAQWSLLAQQQHEAAMKSLDDSGRAQLIAIEAQAKRLIEADTNYSRVFESAMTSLGNVLGNTSLSAEQQRAAQTTILGQVSAFQDFYNRLQGTTIQ